ncbi:NCS2 family permease [Bacillus sp. FJAT-49736]|uniref:NCS2 family permease n=1 Tax=Bacillus sp. FJAT-49736 TaxID=2833582 RepID=UPI001BC9F111|nr:NCS2 family permease [Bacillus sp. FJAT-49736]MBS4173171.1 NCS2 family permease [Bacillus sp. FJAT-49736]
MRKFRLFDIAEHETTIRKEMVAGVIGFFTVAYIIAVNSIILSEAGIPFQGAVLATILISFVGCLLMGFVANAPIILVPGMGINALFTFTLVQAKGFSWQEALGIVFVSGLIFAIIAFTKLAKLLNSAIPQTLKDAISVGLGLFLMLIGLEKGGIVVRGGSSIIALGDLSDLKVLATIFTFIVTIVLFLRNTKGNFLISILFGTILGYFLGLIPHDHNMTFSMHEYGKVFAGLSFANFLSFPFWVAVFSLTMVLVFESIGLIHSQTKLAGSPGKFKRVLQVNAISAALSGIFGSSPTVAAVESTASISAGGRTGITSITAGTLFLCSIFFVPYLKWIPDNAIAPILILIGGLMTLNIRTMDLKDITEAFPAVLIIVMIPFTYSIADGIAIGFILYPLLKVSIGKAKEVTMPLYVISGLFLLNFILQYL